MAGSGITVDLKLPAQGRVTVSIKSVHLKDARVAALSASQAEFVHTCGLSTLEWADNFRYRRVLGSTRPERALVLPPSFGSSNSKCSLLRATISLSRTKRRCGVVFGFHSSSDARITPDHHSPPSVIVFHPRAPVPSPRSCRLPFHIKGMCILRTESRLD